MRATHVATIKQFIQANPAKALELFSRLLDTSDKAIKTRERLFGELKNELELAVNLEEQHLFPVLKSARKPGTSCRRPSVTTSRPVSC